MSELNDMSCREFSDVAAELALGVLTGRERAAAIAHLDHCDACRENVRQLTMTGEGLLELLPTVEPPAGFETRVMERIGLAVAAPSPAPRASWIARTSPSAGSRRPARAQPAAPAWPDPADAGRRGCRGGGRRGWPGWMGPGYRHLVPGQHAAGVRRAGLGQPPDGWEDLPLPGQPAVAVHVGGHAVGERHRALPGAQPGRARHHGRLVPADRWTRVLGQSCTGAHGQVTGARLVTTNGTVLATASFHTA